MKQRKIHFKLATLLLALATVLAFAPDAWIAMMARAFLLQWTVAFLVIALVAAWRRFWMITLSSVVAFVLVSAQLPESPPDIERSIDARHRLVVVHMNVLQPNQRHAAVIYQAMESDADVISFQEVDADWARVLRKELAMKYPYSMIEPRNNCYGIALFSKHSMEEAVIHVVAGSPFMEARINVGESSVRILSVHATSPGSTDHFQRRNIQLKWLKEHLNKASWPVVLIGDLNTVPWDDAFKRFHSGTRLECPTAHGSIRTWPSVGPLAAIPLDHVFHSPELDPIAIRSFSIPGSDHRGLAATFRVP
jgi:endonuclease/exonuclease/phosphatase (EEP) superfamily protein YafD